MFQSRLVKSSTSITLKCWVHTCFFNLHNLCKLKKKTEFASIPHSCENDTTCAYLLKHWLKKSWSCATLCISVLYTFCTCIMFSKQCLGTGLGNRVKGGGQFGFPSTDRNTTPAMCESPTKQAMNQEDWCSAGRNVFYWYTFEILVRDMQIKG